MFIGDVQASIFVVPYLIFPVWGGMPLGFYTTMGIPTSIQLILFLILIALSTTSIVWLFYYRSQVVLPDGHCLKQSRLGRKVFMIFVLVGNHAGLLHIFFFIDGKDSLMMKNEFYQVDTTPIFEVTVNFSNFLVKWR